MEKNWVRRCLHLSMFFVILIVTLFFIPELSKEEVDPTMVEMFIFNFLGLISLLGIYRFFVAFDIYGECSKSQGARRVFKQIKRCISGWILLLLGGGVSLYVGIKVKSYYFFLWIIIGIVAFVLYLLHNNNRSNLLIFFPHLGVVAGGILYMLFILLFVVIPREFFKMVAENQSEWIQKMNEFSETPAFWWISLVFLTILGGIIWGIVDEVYTPFGSSSISRESDNSSDFTERTEQSDKEYMEQVDKAVRQIPGATLKYGKMKDGVYEIDVEIDKPTGYYKGNYNDWKTKQVDAGDFYLDSGEFEGVDDSKNYRTHVNLRVNETYFDGEEED